MNVMEEVLIDSMAISSKLFELIIIFEYMTLEIVFYYMFLRLALKIMDILVISFTNEELKFILIVLSIMLFIPINWIIIQIMMITKTLSPELSIFVVLVLVITIYWVSNKVCEI